MIKPSRKILIAVAVLIIATVAIAVQRFGRSPLQVPQSESPTIQEILVTDPSGAPLDTDFSNPVLPETEAATLDQPADTEMPAMRTETKVTAILEEIKTQIEQQNDAFLYFDDRLEPFSDLIPQLESSIALQSSVADLMDQRLLNLEDRVANLTQTIADSNTANVEDVDSKPPFHLIAIDRWNNEWNAVIQLDGKISMIGLNASRVGWLLVEIDPGEQTALFRAVSGEEAKLRITG